MPGGGKSTVGRHLARSLQLRFVDSDAEIERRIGCPIRVFFEREGEASFRDIEQDVVAELISRQTGVIATGGGTVLREASRHALHSQTTVVYLRSTPEELFRRLRHDMHRPLLQVADPMRKLRDLYAERDPLYRKTAHLHHRDRSSVRAHARQHGVDAAGVGRPGAVGPGAFVSPSLAPPPSR